MTKQWKREVFMACLVRVSRGFLPFGSFNAVAEDFGIHGHTVTKLWYSTMTQVPGYQPNVPIDPPFIVANLPSTAFDTKFDNAGRKPKYDQEAVLQEIKNIDPAARLSVRSLAGVTGIPRSTIGRMLKQGKDQTVHTM